VVVAILIAVAGRGIDAYVHLDLVPGRGRAGSARGSRADGRIAEWISVPSARSLTSTTPAWFPEQLWAAFGEAGAGAASLAGFLLLLIRPGLVIVTTDFCLAGEHSCGWRRINLGPAI